MELESFLKNPQYRYLVCYVSDNEFWCVEESSTIQIAHEIVSKQKILFPKKEFLIIKKTTTHEIAS